MAEYIERRKLKMEIKKWLKPSVADETQMVALDDIAVSTLMTIEEQPTADVVEREKVNKAIEEIEKIDLIVHDGINHYYKDGEEVIAEALEIIKRNVGE